MTLNLRFPYDCPTINRFVSDFRSLFDISRLMLQPCLILIRFYWK